LGPIFFTCSGLGWVGSVSWWLGLGHTKWTHGQLCRVPVEQVVPWSPRVHIPNDMSIGSTVLAQLTVVSNRQTNGQTDHPTAVTIGRILYTPIHTTRQWCLSCQAVWIESARPPDKCVLRRSASGGRTGSEVYKSTQVNPAVMPWS